MLRRLAWMDLLWLAFLAGLAVLPPRTEVHKQLILVAIGLLQLAEGHLLRRWPRAAAVGVVAAKIGLAALLVWHTPLGPALEPGMPAVAINSIYWLIFFLPVITAATYFGPVATLGWTTLSAAAYLVFLIPAREAYDISAAEAVNELALRMLFLYLAAVVVNRIVLEMRRQRDLYRMTADRLEAANRQLREAQAEARRSERLAALGQLSAGLAHEIRNPLAVIKGSAETLQKALPAQMPLAAELAGYISVEVNRVNELVSRFLDFARPLQLRCRLQPLPPLLEQALSAVQARLPQAPVRVRLALAPGLPQLPLDAALVEGVFENLLSNAFEAMAAAGGEVEIAAAPVRGGIEVVVRDTGPGVPAEAREQIFNPFFTTKQTGVGLGLAIVSKIVEQHGGTLRLESPPAGGAAFHVWFPAAADRG